MSVPGFRGSLRAPLVPAWLSERPRAVGFKVLHAFAEWCDRAMEAAIEGTRAGSPGADSRVDALDLICETVDVVRGETETVHHLLARLQSWLTLHQADGGPEGLARDLHEYVAGNPMVRVIGRAPSGLGRWTTCDASGTITHDVGLWDWDSISEPERAAYWWDNWVVVYAGIIPNGLGYYPRNPGNIGTDSGNLAPDATHAWGLGATMPEVDAIKGLVKRRKSAGANVRSLIWAFGDAGDIYAPSLTPIAGAPDGRWGKWYNPDTLGVARNNDRFWSLGSEIT